MSLLTILKTITSLWPFFKEMFFEGKSVREVMMKNKLVAVLVLALFGSIALNYISFSKIFEIAMARKDHTAKVLENKQDKKEVSTAPPLASSQPGDSEENYNEAVARLQKLYRNKSKP